MEALVRLCLVAALLTGTAFADAITQWNSIMLNTISSQSPQAQSRLAAITHLAMFEAVNAVTNNYKPYLGQINAPPQASPDAAAIAAAYRVLRTYFPDRSVSLDAARDASLAGIPEGSPKTEGIALGEGAAAAMIARRSNDGSGTVMRYTPLNNVGMWQPTPPGFAAATFLHWGKVTPFGLSRPDQFRPSPPPALTSRQYARDYNEVKEVGGVLSLQRVQNRTDIARYSSLTNPVPLYNSVAVQLATAQRTPLTENARTFALLNMAMADAAIAVFEAKYHYNTWRPVTAIWAGDADNNPATQADLGFATLITTPPYPSYPSGFGGLSNAGSYVLERTFGSGRHVIALSLPTLANVSLEYKRLREITDDIADARVYGGIHFRFEQDAAEVLGRDVARHLMATQLRCAGDPACEDFAEPPPQ
jgi:hypothetical protein